LENSLEVKSQLSPKTDEILKQILNSPYSGDLLFENAIKSNNERVVKLLLNNGKMASQYQCGLAYGAKMKDLLESQASLSKISAQKRFING